MNIYNTFNINVSKENLKQAEDSLSAYSVKMKINEAGQYTASGFVLGKEDKKAVPFIFKDGVCYISEACIKDAGFDVTYEGGTNIESNVHIKQKPVRQVLLSTPEMTIYADGGMDLKCKPSIKYEGTSR